MDLEEQTLRYYLSLFSIFFILLYFLIFFTFKSLNLENQIFAINKGESIDSIINRITKKENFLEKKIFKLFLILSNKYYAPINYGKFKIYKNSNLIEIITTISRKSNLDYKITIVEGWEEYQLNNYLSLFYKKYNSIPYHNLISDTYLINSSNSFEDFKNFLLINKNNFFNQYKDNDLLKKFGIKNILIISSLVEKEAKNENDKRLIASVIFNRLNSKMKLQIDATVISAITNGKYKLERSLNYDDLKINHPLNTYIIKGIPPKMISYVGGETIKIVLENPKSDFLFYFYNILKQKHIFSENYKEHRTRLNEYRKKSK